MLVIRADTNQLLFSMSLFIPLPRVLAQFVFTQSVEPYFRFTIFSVELARLSQCSYFFHWNLSLLYSLLLLLSVCCKLNSTLGQLYAYSFPFNSIKCFHSLRILHSIIRTLELGGPWN